MGCSVLFQVCLPIDGGCDPSIAVIVETSMDLAADGPRIETSGRYRCNCFTSQDRFLGLFGQHGQGAGKLQVVHSLAVSATS